MRPAVRLDVPRQSRQLLLRRQPRDLPGRVAERTARLIGTGRFLAAQTVVISLWLVANVAPSIRFDPYPFDFLTLVLSLQAAYAAPLILLAQNRQDDRDRLVLASDRSTAVQTRETAEFITRELAALHRVAADLAARSWMQGELQRQLEAQTAEMLAAINSALTVPS